MLLALTIAVPVRAAEVANLRNGFTIRHQRHETLGDLTRLYLSNSLDSGYVDVPTAQIESYDTVADEPQPVSSASPSAAKPDLNSIIRSASDRTQVDADFIASVIHAESANNPKAISPKGAQGLMQLMPRTAGALGVQNAFDPASNVDGGSRYLRDLLIRYDNDMIKALAAYNAGPERVDQYKGVPPYRETRAYVARVVNDYNRKKLAQRKRAVTTETSSPPNRSQMKARTPASTKKASPSHQPPTDATLSMAATTPPPAANR